MACTGWSCSRVETLEQMVCASKVRREEMILWTFRLVFAAQQLHLVRCQSAGTAYSDAFVQSLPRPAQVLGRISKVASHPMRDRLKPSDSIQQSLEETLHRRAKKSSTTPHLRFKTVNVQLWLMEYHKRHTIRPRLGSRTMNIAKSVYPLKINKMARCPT